MNFQIALSFLCLYILGSTASQEPKCVTNKYVEESYTITLNSPQQDGDTLTWKCEEKVIYKRRKGRVDPAADVDDQGSLTLTNMSKSEACTYKAVHHDKDGKLIKEHSESICVLSRIPDPKLEVECSPSGVVTLQCGPQNLPEGITLTWFHNDIEMTDEKSNSLKPQMRGVTDRYKCRLSNGPDAEDSNEETVSCDVSESKCVTNKYVGESYTITLNSPQQDGDTLTWKCDDTVIYRRRKGKIDANMAANVDDQGSLTLTNISKSMACTYKAEHYDKNGKSLKAYSESLCVFQPKCVTNKYVEESYTITLNSPQQDGDTLTWRCEEKVIYRRRKGKVEPAADVDDQGSLTLTNMSKSDACTYKAEHHDKDGKLIKEHSESICVLSRVPDPKLEVECSPSGVVTLQCGPKNLPDDITLTWFHNDIEMTNEKSNPLEHQQRGVTDRYKCRLSNGHDTEDSKEETVSCEI